MGCRTWCGRGRGGPSRVTLRVAGREAGGPQWWLGALPWGRLAARLAVLNGSCCESLLQILRALRCRRVSRLRLVSDVDGGSTTHLVFRGLPFL